MRESRVNIWVNPTTIAAGGTATGPDIPLGQDYVGEHKYAVNPGYGLGFELMAYGVVEGNDSDGFTLAVKLQVAPDNAGAPGSYVDWALVGALAYDITATKGWTKNGLIAGASLGLTRAKLKGRFKGVPDNYAWGRIVVTSGDLEGTATVNVKAWVTDGTDSLNTQNVY